MAELERWLKRPDKFGATERDFCALEPLSAEFSGTTKLGGNKSAFARGFPSLAMGRVAKVHLPFQLREASRPLPRETLLAEASLTWPRARMWRLGPHQAGAPRCSRCF